MAPAAFAAKLCFATALENFRREASAWCLQCLNSIYEYQTMLFSFEGTRASDRPGLRRGGGCRKVAIRWLVVQGDAARFADSPATGPLTLGTLRKNVAKGAEQRLRSSGSEGGRSTRLRTPIRTPLRGGGWHPLDGQETPMPKGRSRRRSW